MVESYEIKAILKYEFIAEKGCEYFSLSDVDMTLAKEFLEFLIEFLNWRNNMANNINLSDVQLYNQIADWNHVKKI